MTENILKHKAEIAVLGAGCFWCTEAIYAHTKGVVAVMPGYAGGIKDNPTYEEVSNGKTGHAEVAKAEFDPNIISYHDLLYIFFSLHDPTTLNRQGNDIGTQYRSIIFYIGDRQKETAEKVITELTQERIFKDKIVTEVKPLEKFWPAEDYHRKYFEHNPEKSYCQLVIEPKLAKFRQKFSQYYKE